MAQFLSPVRVKLEGEEKPKLKIFGSRPPSLRMKEISLREYGHLLPTLDEKGLQLLNQNEQVVYTRVSLQRKEFCKKYKQDLKVAQS